MNDVGSILSGDKPIKFEVSIDTKAAIIIGIVIFVAIASAYYFIRSINK